MKFKRDFRLYLDDILEAIEKIENYSKKLSFKEFSKNYQAIDAIIRNFEIIGEAVKNIPRDVKEKYSDIPWRKMAGIRDKLIHEYFGVNIKVVWKTIKEDLPEVKPKIKEVLRKMNRERKNR